MQNRLIMSRFRLYMIRSSSRRNIQYATIYSLYPTGFRTKDVSYDKKKRLPVEVPCAFRVTSVVNKGNNKLLLQVL